MKFFKRKDDIDPIEVRRTRSHGHDFDIHHVHSRNTPTYAKSDVGLSSSNKRSIGELAKMLNCAATKEKKEDFIGGEQSFLIGGKDSRQIQGIMKRSSSWGGGLRKTGTPYETEITRPVLITIKDGDLGTSVAKKIASRDPSENARAMQQLKKSFTVAPPVGSKAKSSSFLFGASARNRSVEKVAIVVNSTTPNQNSSPNRTKNCDHTSSLNEESKTRSPARSTASTPSQASLLMAREIARRERWKRGLGLEKNPDDGGNRSTFSGASDTHGAEPAVTDGEDSLYAEDRTSFTHSTGGTSHYTDFSSLGGYSTEATETDESGEDSRYYCERNDRGSPPQLDPPSSNFTGGSHCASRQQVISGITEDFGIVASFLWADGAACLGTAAAITRETVSGGCKPDP
jgi:hypothetical protein